MSRLFDKTSLLNDDLAENATRRDPLPEGETIAQVTKLDIASGSKDGKAWNRLDVTLEITDPDYLARMEGERDKAVTNLGIMLDMNGTQIATGPDRNVRLGRFRAACGVNGKPLSALIGQFVRITIQHKPHPTEEGVTLDNITAFAPA